MRYSQFDVLMASPTDPMPKEKTRHQLTRMLSGLASIEAGEEPSRDDWRVCSDAVNLMETLTVASPITVAHLDGNKRVQDVYEINDTDGLLEEAIAALAIAGKRHVAGEQIRLDAQGIKAVRSVLENYAALLEQLPERVIIQCHRQTEKRIQEIMAGKRKPHDIEVTAI